MKRPERVRETYAHPRMRPGRRIPGMASGGISLRAALLWALFSLAVIVACGAVYLSRFP